MVPMGPERWGPESEEWVIHLNYPADDPRAQSDAQVEADARRALGIEDAPLKIHKITRWAVERRARLGLPVGPRLVAKWLSAFSSERWQLRWSTRRRSAS